MTRMRRVVAIHENALNAFVRDHRESTRTLVRRDAPSNWTLVQSDSADTMIYAAMDRAAGIVNRSTAESDRSAVDSALSASIAGSWTGAGSISGSGLAT